MTSVFKIGGDIGLLYTYGEARVVYTFVMLCVQT